MNSNADRRKCNIGFYSSSCLNLGWMPTNCTNRRSRFNSIRTKHIPRFNKRNFRQNTISSNTRRLYQICLKSIAVWSCSRIVQSSRCTSSKSATLRYRPSLTFCNPSSKCYKTTTTSSSKPIKTPSSSSLSSGKYSRRLSRKDTLSKSKNRRTVLTLMSYSRRKMA
jgi:hypothetical protein